MISFSHSPGSFPRAVISPSRHISFLSSSTAQLPERITVPASLPQLLVLAQPTPAYIPPLHATESADLKVMSNLLCQFKSYLCVFIFLTSQLPSMQSTTPSVKSSSLPVSMMPLLFSFYLTSCIISDFLLASLSVWSPNVGMTGDCLDLFILSFSPLSLSELIWSHVFLHTDTIQV